MDAKADLSLRWAQMPFCWFCHEAAHLINIGETNENMRSNSARRAQFVIIDSHIKSGNLLRKIAKPKNENNRSKLIRIESIIRFWLGSISCHPFVNQTHDPSLTACCFYFFVGVDYS